MIHLTKLNKHPIGVNADLIKFIENAPDTMITLLTGEKLLVLESFEEILERIVAYRQQILAGLDLSDYIANAKGVEVARLPGIQRGAAAGNVEMESPGPSPSETSSVENDSSEQG